MKITKRQLRRIIKEAEGSTKKYDDDSALRGGQSTLPDRLQKSIIDKAVEDREEQEEQDREEKNESLKNVVLKTTKKQIRRFIKEEAWRLLEYEQHVYTDDEGITWLVDDEGNRERKSAKFGQQWGGESGETYTGTRMPWAGGGRSSGPRVFERPQWIVDQIMAIEASIKLKPNKFLTSVLSQIKRSKGRGLSDKQNNIVKKILAKTNPDKVFLFEEKKMKITSHQLRQIIKEYCHLN